MTALAALGCAAHAQSFAGFDDFAGGDAKWSYAFRAPALTVGTNGKLNFTGSVLEFTKAADRGSYLLGWGGGGMAASYTTSWVAEITATNHNQPESGAFSSVGFEVAISPTAYTEVTLENSGGTSRVRTETNSATTGVASATASTNTDVRLRISWDATARTLTVSYSFDAGASYATLRTLPITDWPTQPTKGFYFELMGYSVSAAAIPAGQMQIDNFSVTAAPADYPRLSNLSARNLTAEGERTLILGFSVAGEGTRPMVIRGISDTLGSAFGVPNVVGDVDLALYTGTTNLATATGITAGMSDAFRRVGAFSIAATTTDATMVRSLPAGAYTVHVVPAPTSTRREGAAMIEIYEDGRYGTRFNNVSARTQLGSDPLIVGFTVSGDRTTRVLIRAIGPGLMPFGVTNAVTDPKLSVVRMSTGATVAQNDNWSTATGVSDAVAATGAFGVPAGSKDAAVVVDLDPGSYSVLIGKTDPTAGVVLAEIYQVPTP